MLFVYLIIGILILFAVLKAIIKLNLMIISFVIIAVAVCFTIGVCISKPDMHKPFNLNIIEYLIKINDDGSVSTTKQTTTTVLKDVK